MPHTTKKITNVLNPIRRKSLMDEFLEEIDALEIDENEAREARPEFISENLDDGLISPEFFDLD